MPTTHTPVTEERWSIIDGHVYSIAESGRLVPVTVDGEERQHRCGLVALVYGAGLDESGAPREERARLIAAAPKLLAALLRLTEEALTPTTYAEMMSDARAAIRAARGEE